MSSFPSLLKLKIMNNQQQAKIVRLSILKDDPRYTADASRYNVFLNGEKQTSCLIADSENGYVLRYKKNKIGVLCKGRNGKLITEEVFGNVVITIKV